MNLNNAEFIKSAAAPKDFMRDGLKQLVFAGRSNVGKSSVINKLLNRKNFARVGGSPGKTVHVNYFLIDKTIYFVDLPGYGYAKVSGAEKERWSRLIESYFASGLISVGVQIVDIRHKPTDNDVVMSEWFKASGMPYVVVANKADKAKKSEIEGSVKLISETLGLDESVSIVPFSAEKGTGKPELWALLNSLLQL